MATNPMQSTIMDNLVERLGSPKEITLTARQLEPKRPFAARHPWLVFALAPLPLWLATLIAYVLTIGLIGWAWDWSSHVVPGQLPWWGYAAFYGILYVPVTLVTLTLTWIALRNRVGVWWWLASLALPLLITAHSQLALQLSRQPGHNSVRFGISFPPRAEGILQILVPLLVAVAAWFWFNRRQVSDQLDGLAS